MSKPHPLAEEIKKWADAPDDWQWQILTHPYGQACWENCTFDGAMATYHQAVCKDRHPLRIIPKRQLIPADRLPEGWEVERRSGNNYLVSINGGPQFGMDHDDPLNELLRHIDPEAK